MRWGTFTKTLKLGNKVFHMCTSPDLCSPTEGLARPRGWLDIVCVMDCLKEHSSPSGK